MEKIIDKDAGVKLDIALDRAIRVTGLFGFSNVTKFLKEEKKKNKRR